MADKVNQLAQLLAAQGPPAVPGMRPAAPWDRREAPDLPQTALPNDPGAMLGRYMNEQIAPEVDDAPWSDPTAILRKGYNTLIPQNRKELLTSLASMLLLPVGGLGARAIGAKLSARGARAAGKAAKKTSLGKMAKETAERRVGARHAARGGYDFERPNVLGRIPGVQLGLQAALNNSLRNEQ